MWKPDEEGVKVCTSCGTPMGVVQQPQPQPQAVPQPPISANILIQKKEQKSLLLESVIDFASLVFHCVGSAIYAYQSGIGYYAE